MHEDHLFGVANQLLGLFTADHFLGARRDVDADLVKASPHGRFEISVWCGGHDSDSQNQIVSN